MNSISRKRIGFVLERKPSNFIESAIEGLSKCYTVVVGFIREPSLQRNIDAMRIKLPKTPKLTQNLIFRMAKPFVKDLNTSLIRLYKERSLGLLPKGKRYLRKFANICPKIVSSQDLFKYISKGSNFYDEFMKIVDVIVFIPTEPTDYRIIYEAKNRGKKIISWIYSWDTLFKDRYFIDFTDLYLVWNEEMKEDLIKVHGIDVNRIRLSGPIQFDYLKKYKDSEVDFKKHICNFENDDRYILYPCCRGDPYYSAQEVELICEMAKVIRRVDRTVKLVVRIYPDLLDISFVDKLKNYDNILLNDNFGISNNRLYMSEEDLKFKCQLIKKSSIVINLGTTMGLEASYFDIPILQLNFDVYVSGIPEGWRLKNMLEGDHLQKYLLRDRGLPNIINNLDELEYTIADALKNPEKYLAYTKFLRKFIEPYPELFYQDKLIREIVKFVSSSR